MPPPIRHAILEGLKLHRRLTSGLRGLPDYLIIGTQRGGTTSLYNYFIKHPACAAAFQKEIHFFDLHYDKGPSWYRAHFPIAARKEHPGWITGEASPYYLAHPHAPRRASQSTPLLM